MFANLTDLTSKRHHYLWVLNSLADFKSWHLARSSTTLFTWNILSELSTVERSRQSARKRRRKLTLQKESGLAVQSVLEAVQCWQQRASVHLG